MYYSLIGQDGNAFALMGYTAIALRETDHKDLIDQMREEAMSGDYYNLIAVCDKYVEIANDTLRERGEYEEEDDEDDWGWDDEEEEDY